MRITKTQLLLLVSGALLVGATVSATAQDTPAPEADAKAEGRPAEKMGKGMRHAFESEFSVQTDEGIKRFRSYAGELVTVSGSTLVISTPDGNVEVVVNDTTKIHRDKAEAQLSDLVAGDHVRATQNATDDGEFSTMHVGAISAEKFAEMEAKREACKADPTSCERPGKRRGFGPGRGGDRPAGPADSEDVTFIPPEVA